MIGNINDFLNDSNIGVIYEFEEDGEFGDSFILFHELEDCFILENSSGELLTTFRKDALGFVDGTVVDGYSAYKDFLLNVDNIFIIKGALN